MPEKRDVREEMIKAADFVSAMNLVSGLSGEGTRPELDLASRVLKHEAGAMTAARRCTNSEESHVGVHESCRSRVGGVGRGPECGWPTVELIERYRGQDA